jgi:hypothetical protein
MTNAELRHWAALKHRKLSSGERTKFGVVWSKQIYAQVETDKSKALHSVQEFNIMRFGFSNYGDSSLGFSKTGEFKRV